MTQRQPASWCTRFIDNRDQHLVKLGHGGSIWRPNTLSCSLMKAQLPVSLYRGRASGFVLSSSAVKRALLCSYPWDAGTVLSVCPNDWRSSDTCAGLPIRG